MKMKDAIEKLREDGLALYNEINSWEDLDLERLTVTRAGVTRAIPEPAWALVHAAKNDYLRAHADDIRMKLLRELRTDLMDAGVRYTDVVQPLGMESNRVARKVMQERQTKELVDAIRPAAAAPKPAVEPAVVTSIAPLVSALKDAVVLPAESKTVKFPRNAEETAVLASPIPELQNWLRKLSPASTGGSQDATGGL